MVLLGSSFSTSDETNTGDVSDIMVELGLIQDVVGRDEDIMDVPLRSCWEPYVQL